jgi:tetratricopeptide (TPR) repeat protein
MSKIKLLFIFFYFQFFFQPGLLLCQDKIDPKEWFVEAESYFLFEEYKDALPLYQMILREDPENYNVIYKIGICYLNDVYQKGKSISYLKKAAENINNNYKINSYKERLAPPEALYYLGKAYHVNNKFDEAIECYQRFLNSANPDQFDFDIVNEDIAACQRAKKIYSDPVYFTSHNLGSMVNSRFEDFNPVLSGDGKVLAFTRRLQFYDGVFLSNKNDDGSWSDPVNLTGDFALDGNSYTTGISYHGDEIFVYRSDNYDGNIYSSKKINNAWNKLEKLNSNINTKYWESHASPTFDGQYLIFTSNREGGYGGLDIYKSKLNSSGDWGPAVNMGPVINSPSNEETPFMSNQGYTLFFSSQGHNTIGGYDVFISHLKDDGSWSKPYNMGYPINTSDDDLFYYPIGVDNIGLYAISAGEHSEGLLDIYQVEVYNMMIPRTFTVTGKLHVDDPSSKTFKKLSIKLYDPKSNQMLKQETVGEDGTFALQTTQGEYLLVVDGPETETYRKNINLQVAQPESSVSLPDITLKRTEIPSTLVEIITPPVTPQIITKKDFYTVTDSSAIPIDLILSKGSDLEVIIKLNDAVILTENIPDVKKRFTYFYKPQKGENLLKFTATDPEGLVSTTEVVVLYNPPEPGITTKISRAEKPEKPLDSESLVAISGDELSVYLSKIDLTEFGDYMELYKHLLLAADTNGFSKKQVDNMFAIYFTQKDEKEFSNEFETTFSEHDVRRTQLADSISLPLVYLNSLARLNYLSEGDIRDALLRMHTSDIKIDANDFYDELVNFSPVSKNFSKPERTISTIQNAWETYIIQINPDSALESLKLFSTTEDMQFFYQNLLVNSKEGLHEYLTELRLEPEEIHTSIELTEHLLEQATGEFYTVDNLFETLELARINKRYYLNRFIDMLISRGEGNLKSQLIFMNKERDQIETYEDLFGYLLNQSRYKNYSLESVYSLFIDLIGIEDVGEFADKIQSYGYLAINRALQDTSLSYFSNPLELIQYLLAATRTYDFTESDINNLLIRMILEKGLDEKSLREIDQIQGRFWRSRKFLTTLILVNIVLIILILLFSFRRKRTKQ